MVRTSGRGTTATCECLRSPFVGSEPPTAGRRLIHGSTQERVAKAKPSGNVCRSDKVEPRKRIKRLENGSLGDRRGRRCELRLERIPRDGGPLEHEPVVL